MRTKKLETEPVAHARAGATASGAAAAVKAYQDGAAGILAQTPELTVADPPEAQAKASRVVTYLRSLVKDGVMPLVGLHPDYGNASWVDILNLLIADSIEAANATGAKTVVAAKRDGDTPLQTVEKNAATVQRQIRDAIEGLEPLPEDLALSKKLLGDRPVPTGQSKWENEFKTIIGLLSKPSNGFPKAATDLLKDARDTLEALESVVALSGPRPEEDRIEWATSVRPSSLALRLALNDLFRYAQTRGNEAQQNGLKGAAHGRRPADKASNTPADTEKKKPGSDSASSESTDSSGTGNDGAGQHEPPKPE